MSRPPFIRRNASPAIVAALLAGCAGVPGKPAPAPSAVAAQPPQAPPPALARPPDARRPGGFYLDDGPGGPVDLANLREPEPRVEPLHRFANNPYTVFGQTFVPERELRAGLVRGVASWYGRRFHGLPTSSGEPYDMYQLTAAHPTLPIPSYARVTNVATGRSVIVRINDRGPFLKGRAIDLSYAAATRLGYAEQGSALVEIESLNPAEGVASRPAGAALRLASASQLSTPTPRRDAASAPTAAQEPATGAVAGRSVAPAPGFPVAEDPNGLFLQLGAFQSRDNAESFRTRLMFQVDEYAALIQVVQREGFHRILAGPFRDRAEVASAASRFAAQR